MNGWMDGCSSGMFLHLILFLSYSQDNYGVTMSEGPWRGHFSFEKNSSLKIFDRLIWKKIVCC